MPLWCTEHTMTAPSRQGIWRRLLQPLHRLIARPLHKRRLNLLVGSQGTCRTLRRFTTRVCVHHLGCSLHIWGLVEDTLISVIGLSLWHRDDIGPGSDMHLRHDSVVSCFPQANSHMISHTELTTSLRSSIIIMFLLPLT